MADDKKDGIERDEFTGTETTGHEWDGITELNTPLPRWWLQIFYATIVWGVVYTIAYPAWPLVSTYTKGVLGYSSRAAVAEDIAEHAESQRVYTDRIAAMEIDEVAADPELLQFAKAGGSAVFKAYCSQCHGAGGAGVQAAGYPNLLDDDWLWGGTREAIYTTLKHGIRYDGDDDTRLSEMPAFGADEILEPADIATVAEYVLKLSGQDHDNTAIEAGTVVYEENCSACHGEAGEGNHDLGAPNIADAIWLYGGTREKIVETITYSRAGVMPGWASRLSDDKVKQVALYVHELGGGE